MHIVGLKPWLHELGKFFYLVWKNIANFFVRPKKGYPQPFNLKGLLKATKPIQILSDRDCDHLAIATAVNNLNKFLENKVFGFQTSRYQIQIALTDDMNSKYIGTATYSSPISYIKIRPAYKSSLKTLEHELLHSLGFEHSDDPRSRMFPSIGINQKLTQEIKEIYQQHGV